MPALKKRVLGSWLRGHGWYSPEAQADAAMSRAQALKFKNLGILPSTLVLDHKDFNVLNQQKPNTKKKRHSSSGKRDRPQFGTF